MGEIPAPDFPGEIVRLSPGEVITADTWLADSQLSQWIEISGAAATPSSSAEMVEAWEKHDQCKSRMLGWMKSYDVFICPVSGKPAQPIDVPAGEGTGGGGGAPTGWPYTGACNCTGWPSVVVRCGTSSDGKNLPIGLQVVCAPWREDICLAVASYLETRSGGWQRPPI